MQRRRLLVLCTVLGALLALTMGAAADHRGGGEPPHEEHPSCGSGQAGASNKHCGGEPGRSGEAPGHQPDGQPQGHGDTADDGDDDPPPPQGPEPEPEPEPEPDPTTNSDADPVPDGVDNCDHEGDVYQLDADGDGQGNACDDDSDSDGDGTADGSDACPTTYNKSNEPDTDGDGKPDACDPLYVVPGDPLPPISVPGPPSLTVPTV